MSKPAESEAQPDKNEARSDDSGAQEDHSITEDVIVAHVVKESEREDIIDLSKDDL